MNGIEMPYPPQMALWGFLYFCRIGGMFMLFPGFSSTRVPRFARLMLAIGVTFALAPLLLHVQGATPPAREPLPGRLLALAWQEVVKGAAFGLMGRMFFLAFSFLATALAQFAGLGNFPGVPAEGSEPMPALTSLVMLTATLLVFTSGAHMQALTAVVESYAVLPIGTPGLAETYLSGLVERLSQATFVSLQAVAPFVIYAVLANLAIGLINRMTPQIPAYFISLPLVMAGGLVMLHFMSRDMFDVVFQAFTAWLAGG